MVDTCNQLRVEIVIISASQAMTFSVNGYLLFKFFFLDMYYLSHRLRNFLTEKSLCTFLDKFIFSVSQHPIEFEIDSVMMSINNKRESFLSISFE